MSAAQRGRLDEVLCILEVLASMTLAPQVADAAMPASDFLAQVGGREEGHGGGKPRGVGMC